MTNPFVMILGAKSDIALATAHRFAADGCDLMLGARNIDELLSDKADLEIRYNVHVSLHEFNALDLQSHEYFVKSLPTEPNIVISAIGYLGEQLQSECDQSKSIHAIRTNFEGPANILAIFANYFEKRGHGTLIGISSVAGERGRASNYIYGSAKAGFTAWLSGLRNRLWRKGVHVITVLPGFVNTKMTDGMNLPRLLTAEPSEVAEAIYHAAKNKKSIVYCKKVWWPIMLIIKLIPERFFVKLRI